MTDSCLLLDAYLDGTLPDDHAERFEMHAAECAACESALALPADLGDALGALAQPTCPPDVLALALASMESELPAAWQRELRELSATACPPDVVTAALRQARRAADRPVARPARRTPVWRTPVRWSVGLAAMVAIALGWALRPQTEPTRPTGGDLAVAEQVPPSLAPPTPLDRPARDSTLQPAEADVAVASPEPAVAASGASPAAPPAVRALRPAAAVPTPDDAAPSEVTPDLLAEQSAARDTLATPAEIESAQRDLALAFGLVAEAQSRAGRRVRQDTDELSSTIGHTLPF